ncbi:hypothetical protein BT96DRAFT_914398 [Gymnopus androsaceus JB14]|uniref:phosphoethanolamine N-methyltransferase n=1 Tax=Gymnopus androsaceus JB14 TaxID=1447944 RepID=A0A6A4IGE9_9AGAR|nr:hypothetical protein BT96DRAFT_914398 [Gymnopus androsaceus JB14]
MTPRTKASDPYGLFHLSLNMRPGEDVLKTEWLNMGYWRDTNIFPDACQALALKLIQTAQCKEQGKVLDVGHGTGESLILLLTHPSIPCLSHLTGITSIPLHHKRSLERVKRIDSLGTTVSLHVGDAVHQETNTTTHPLSSSSPTRFDTILALDCAYHFKTREAFLTQSFERLEGGGRIALADICFATAPPITWKARIIQGFLKLMSKENAISIDKYEACLKCIGFVDVIVEDISMDVFPGFVGFLRQRGPGWWIFGTIIYWYYIAGVRFVLASGSRPK